MELQTTTTRYYSAASEGIAVGSWYLDEAKAKAHVEALNRSWNGVRTFTLKSWEQSNVRA